jgi:hypothetical protein
MQKPIAMDNDSGYTVKCAECNNGEGIFACVVAFCLVMMQVFGMDKCKKLDRLEIAALHYPLLLLDEMEVQELKYPLIPALAAKYDMARAGPGFHFLVQDNTVGKVLHSANVQFEYRTDADSWFLRKPSSKFGPFDEIKDWICYYELYLLPGYNNNRLPK